MKLSPALVLTNWLTDWLTDLVSHAQVEAASTEAYDRTWHDNACCCNAAHQVHAARCLIALKGSTLQQQEQPDMSQATACF